MGLAENRKFSYEEYLQVREETEKIIEYINGHIYFMSPTPTRFHQRIIKKILFGLDKYFEGSKCETHVSPLEVKFIKDDEKNSVYPDLFVECDGSKFSDNDCIYLGIPIIVVEVLSPSTARIDLSSKKDLYERFGVQEYWIVRPKSKTVDIFILEDGEYKEPMSYNKAEILKSELFKDLEINLKDVFDE